MSAEHNLPDDPSPHGHDLTPEQIARLVESFQELEYFEVTLHHPVLDEFQTVDMWSTDMLQAVSSVCRDLQTDGWHVTAVARDCHDCSVADDEVTPDDTDDQERFDRMFDEIIRGNDQS